jgi:hypothetical protein
MAAEPAGEGETLVPPLRAGRRFAALAAIAIAGSLLLPWYGFRIKGFGTVAQTGLDAFGWGQATLILVVAAALVLIALGARGYRPPRPLSEGSLLLAAGIWAGLVCGYLMLDRPEELESFTTIRLRYGIFVAVGAAAALALGGLRVRQEARQAPAAGALSRGREIRGSDV